MKDHIKMKNLGYSQEQRKRNPSRAAVPWPHTAHTAFASGRIFRGCTASNYSNRPATRTPPPPPHPCPPHLPQPCHTQFLHTPHHSAAAPVHTATPAPGSSQSARSTPRAAPRPTPRARAPAAAPARSPLPAGQRSSLTPAGLGSPTAAPAPGDPPCRWWGAPGCRCCSWWGKASPSRGPTIQARQPVTLRLQRCPPLRTSRHLGRIYAAQGGGEVAAQAGRKEEGRRDESPFEVSTGVTEEQLPFRKTCSLLQTSAAPPRDSRPVLRSPVLPVRGTVQECAGQSLPAGEAAPPAQSGRGRRREVRRRCRVAIRTTPEQDARSVAAVSQTFLASSPSGICDPQVTSLSLGASAPFLAASLDSLSRASRKNARSRERSWDSSLSWRC
ncbi:uncharacterized protein [Patagioenas fasciata]|uniref:uncharacterized protein isoform X1 n=1 Tax=Patagioenas fasciata TaxID=372321 RepID=UPI003A98F33A